MIDKPYLVVTPQEFEKVPVGAVVLWEVPSTIPRSALAAWVFELKKERRLVDLEAGRARPVDWLLSRYGAGLVVWEP